MLSLPILTKVIMVHTETAVTLIHMVKVMVKQSRYRSRVAQMVPGS